MTPLAQATNSVSPQSVLLDLQSLGVMLARPSRWIGTSHFPSSCVTTLVQATMLLHLDCHNSLPAALSVPPCPLQSDPITPQFGTLPVVPHLNQSKLLQSHTHLTPLTSFMSSPVSLPLTVSSPATLASWLFPELIRQHPASGPLHLPFLLLEILFPQIDT